MYCFAAWNKQEGRPVASQKQAPQRLDETLRRLTHKLTPLSQAREPCANNEELEQGQWDTGIVHTQAEMLVYPVVRNIQEGLLRRVEMGLG